MDIKEDIKKWVEHLSTKQVLLGGFSVCPYSKNAEYEIIHTAGDDIDPPPWDFELIIYVLPDDYTEKEVLEITDLYNQIHSDLVFLPDPKDRYTEINSVQTNNGKHNLILCQWRDNLNEARSKLINTPYYSFWNEDYLNEILNQ
jgi:hypothetical protein